MSKRCLMRQSRFTCWRFPCKTVIYASKPDYMVQAKPFEAFGIEFGLVGVHRPSCSGDVRIPRDSATHSSVIRLPAPRVSGRVSQRKANQEFQVKVLA